MFPGTNISDIRFFYGIVTLQSLEVNAGSYGLDDSFEWFGGTMDTKYLVGAFGADDYFDGQIGWSGHVQFGAVLANSDLSNRGMEMDNYERDFGARPLGNPTFYNLTFVGKAANGFDEPDSPCLYFRRGAGGIYNNIVCQNWTTRGDRY